jgi:hypothetical protein
VLNLSRGAGVKITSRSQRSREADRIVHLNYGRIDESRPADTNS